MLKAMCYLPILLSGEYLISAFKYDFLYFINTVVLTALFIVKHHPFRGGDNLFAHSRRAFDQRMQIRIMIFFFPTGVHEKGMNPNCGQLE